MRPASPHCHDSTRRPAAAAARPVAPWAVALAFAAATASPGPAQGGPAAPATLAATGLYADFATRTLEAGVLPFNPQYPLWTDGAAKRRWIGLPAGGTIDASDPDAWVFPVGTRFWKEFSFGGRRVETRYMELGPTGWIFATYLWNEEESSTTLAPERGLRGARDIGGGVRHDLPGRWDCLACHAGNQSAVLGFGALQLSSDRDPLAPHSELPEAGAVDLARLLELGLIRGLPESLEASPPRIEAASAAERAALGYLHGNCSSCHNTRGPLASLGLSFEVRLAPAHGPEADGLATTHARPANYRPHGGEALARIAPGDPEASLLVRRMASRQPQLQMPPLGTHLVDEQAVALIADWIRQLDRGGEAPAQVPTLMRSTRLTSLDSSHQEISR